MWPVAADGLLHRGYRLATDCLERVRDGSLGTLTIVAALILVFQIELLAAVGQGFESPKTLFDTLSAVGKRVLAVTLGPFIHQGYKHLFGNVVVVLLAGGYVENAYSRRDLYVFYPLVGFPAAWLPVAIGFAGALGASGFAYGLRAWIAVHSGIRVASALFEIGRRGEQRSLSRLLHLFPFFFGAIGIRTATVAITSSSTIGAGDIAHFFGVILGTLWGIKQATVLLPD